VKIRLTENVFPLTRTLTLQHKCFWSDKMTTFFEQVYRPKLGKFKYHTTILDPFLPYDGILTFSANSLPQYTVNSARGIMNYTFSATIKVI